MPELARAASRADATYANSRLGEIIARLESGVSVNGADRPARSGEPGVLKVSSVTEGRFDPRENKAVTHSEISRLGIFPRAGDILVSRANTTKLVGASAYIDRDYPNLHLPDKLWRAELADPERDTATWLKHVLSLGSVRARIAARATGTSGSMKNISQPALLSIEVPRPNRREQRKIADILDTWDRAVEAHTRLARAKRRLKRGLMQQLLTGKRRFEEFVFSGQLQSTLLGSLPADWRIARLGELFKPSHRKNDDGVSRVLTMSGRHGLVDQRDYFNRSVAGKSLARYYLLRRGEFAYNRSSMKGYPFGAIKRLDRYEEGVLSTLYLCFELVEPEGDSDFYAHLFESGFLNSQLRRIAHAGARAHGLLNVSAGDFLKMSVPVPSVEEQRAIAGVLSAADREIDLLSEQLTALKEQKRGLMQKLLTGEVRVKV